MGLFLSRHRWPIRVIIALTLSLLFVLSSTLLAFANVALTRLSTDPYTNSTSQHQTEVEPDTYSFGTTIVSAFQVGRFNNGGGSNIGFATSTDGGQPGPMVSWAAPPPLRRLPVHLIASVIPRSPTTRKPTSGSSPISVWWAQIPMSPRPVPRSWSVARPMAD